MDQSPEDQMFGKGKGTGKGTGKKPESFSRGHKKGGAMHKKGSMPKMSERNKSGSGKK